MLAAVNEHRDQFIAWADQGVSFHGVHITIPSVETDDDLSDPPSANDDPLQWYIQTETISLLHHALETLLRLYTGLIDASDWSEPLMALADRDRRLPRLVEQHITGKHKHEMRSDVSYLLLGQEVVPDDDADRLAVMDNLSGVLHVLAREWLDARHSYNAIKHGLRVSQTDASFSLGLTANDLVSVADGPSIAFLNHTDWERRPPGDGDGDGRMRHWSVETHWISFGHASKLIATSCMLIDCLWSLAVARWSESGVDDLRLELPDPDEINPRMLQSSDDGPSGQHMSWNLFTGAKPASAGRHPSRDWDPCGQFGGAPEAHYPTCASVSDADTASLAMTSQLSSRPGQGSGNMVTRYEFFGQRICRSAMPAVRVRIGRSIC